MERFIIDKSQVHELVAQNRYEVDPKAKFLSRCIDGRYQNEENLPPLAIPGADLGELGIILATANSFGNEIDQEKTLSTLLKVLGGAENFHFHSDHHADPKTPSAGCGHWREIKADGKSYNLEKSQIDFMAKSLAKLKKQGALEVVLEGSHNEAAVLQATGNFSIYPRFFLQTPEGRREVEVFVYQATLVNERHRALAGALLKSGALKLYPGLNEENLYYALSEETENQLFETARRLAKGLPIYKVAFKDNGSFEIEDLGKV